MPATLPRPAYVQPEYADVLPELPTITLKELLKLPRAEQDAIVFRQAQLAADLALPHAARELTAFESLNSFAPIHKEAADAPK